MNNDRKWHYSIWACCRILLIRNTPPHGTLFYPLCIKSIKNADILTFKVSWLASHRPIPHVCFRRAPVLLPIRQPNLIASILFVEKLSPQHEIGVAPDRRHLTRMSGRRFSISLTRSDRSGPNIDTPFRGIKPSLGR